MSYKFLVGLLFFTFCLEGTTINEMTIEEKVGQLLIVHFHGEAANEDARRLIEEAHVGGFIFYNWANGLKSPKQVQQLSNGLQHMAEKSLHPIPLFITADQEGGFVNRLSTGFTIFPGNRAVAETKSLKLAQACAYAMGVEMCAVGINMNLAPVVDVDVSTKPVIGIRSFSSSPKEVIKYGKSSLKGYREANVIAVLKHFPGYGAVTIDPHAGLPTVNKTREELDKMELYPFRNLGNQADAIMTAHICLPAIDAKLCATLSPGIIHGILRQEYDFKGLILSDSLIMRGVTDSCGDVAEASIQAFLAGHDLLVLGGKLLDQEGQAELSVEDSLRVFHKLVEAVKSGRISEKRLNESVGRILAVKENYRLHNYFPTTKEIDKKVNTREHQLLSKKVAKKALCLVKNTFSGKVDLKKSKVVVVAPSILKDVVEQIMPKNTRFLFFEGFTPKGLEKEMEALLEWGDGVVFFSSDAWKYREQVEWMNSIVEKKPLVVIATRNPQDGEVVPAKASLILTHSPVKDSLEAAIESLQK